MRPRIALVALAAFLAVGLSACTDSDAAGTDGGATPPTPAAPAEPQPEPSPAPAPKPAPKPTQEPQVPAGQDECTTAPNGEQLCVSDLDMQQMPDLGVPSLEECKALAVVAADGRPPQECYEAYPLAGD